MTEAVWTEVSLEDLPAILAGSRKRGLYLEHAKGFEATGFAGAKLDTENGPFAGKNANALLSGFNNILKIHPEHKETLGKLVEARKVGDDVYLVRIDG